jgi:hypothetical protein
MLERMERLWRRGHDACLGNWCDDGDFLAFCTPRFSRRCPFADSERLVWIARRNAEGRFRSLPKNRVEDWRRTRLTESHSGFWVL